MVSLITLFGAVDGAGVLTRTLSTDAGATRARPVDAGNLLDEQLRASTPLDAYTWSQLSDATVIRLLPGMEGGLDPALARTLSGATHGLVLALEAVRTRDRYLVGSFLSGRTVEYSSSIEGIASGPLGARLADDEVPAEIFTAWLEAVLGPTSYQYNRSAPSQREHCWRRRGISPAKTRKPRCAGSQSVIRPGGCGWRNGRAPC